MKEKHIHATHQQLIQQLHSTITGITLAITTFIGLIVRYAVQEFDPSVSTITVTTSKINNRDIAQLSVSKHFLERILEFIEESVAIVATIIPLGFPLCTIFNRYFAKVRSGIDKIEINNNKVLNIIPKYIVIGDAQACQLPNSIRLRPLVRDTIYQLIKTRIKPKLIVEDSYDEARKLGIRIGLIKREHHKLAVIKSVDLLKNITDSRGDIKQGKVRYLLSRLKIMSQATPADKSLLVYLIKHCETDPNEGLAYLGYSFTDPEAMRMVDCAITFQDCDDDDVKKDAQVLLKSENMTFTDLYLFLVVCLLKSNITQSYALYQISASISGCVYRFLSITVFQEQLISHSQFTLIVIIQQVFALIALMTKWLSSLPQAPLRSSSAAEMSHAATEESLAAAAANSNSSSAHHHRSNTSISGTNGYGHRTSRGEQQQQHHHHPHPHRHSRHNQPELQTSIKMHKMNADDTIQTFSMESSGSCESSSESVYSNDANQDGIDAYAIEDETLRRKSRQSLGQNRTKSRNRNYRNKTSDSNQHIHLSGINFDHAVINSKLVNTYKQTFHNTTLIDDITYRLAKLHIAYQILVMIIIMLFGKLIIINLKFKSLLFTKFLNFQKLTFCNYLFSSFR